jgi:hypothetical protein
MSKSDMIYPKFKHFDRSIRFIVYDSKDVQHILSIQRAKSMSKDYELMTSL